jgi:Zn-dependent peptidase ImmA (M78 family)
MSFQYYEELKQLARDVRHEYGVTAPRVLRSDLKRIYKDKGITLDYWPYRLKGLRGAYFNDENGVSIMVSKDLPDDPLVFTMAHELKHHLVDSSLGLVNCINKNINRPIEIGAEVFAAEFLFPEASFIQLMEDMGVEQGQCTAEEIVRLKHETKTTLSYTGLVKKAEWLNFAIAGSLPQSGWKRLEEQIFGVPFYKRRKQKILS